MKLAIIGAAGARAPIFLEAISRRQDQLGLTELALMDIDGDHLQLMTNLAMQYPAVTDRKFKLTITTDPRTALKDADFVVTTFRVGGMEGRVIDERVALNLGILGQETTGPGGFAMGMRSIPVLGQYIDMMREVCPEAWLINFANPSGMLAEYAVNYAGWKRTVGICDGPASMRAVAAAVLQTSPKDILFDYFGLNHLGWVRAIQYRGKDVLPGLIDLFCSGKVPVDLPFDPIIVKTLGMIPNEYLHYFYSSRETVERLMRAEQTRGEKLLEANRSLFIDLAQLQRKNDQAGAVRRYQDYLNDRQYTYMKNETGNSHAEGPGLELGDEGYAGVALDLISALSGGPSCNLILNIPNHGAIHGMEDAQVVEIPAMVSRNQVSPLAIGKIPPHCLGLMSQVKAYELLTIQAATQHSYQKAMTALAIHPLVQDTQKAKALLDGYQAGHRDNFPSLN